MDYKDLGRLDHLPMQDRFPIRKGLIVDNLPPILLSFSHMTALIQSNHYILIPWQCSSNRTTGF